MPSVSRAQQRLMHGVASGSIKPKAGQPSMKVAKDFVAADHKRGPTKLPTNVGSAIMQGKSVKEM